MLYEKEVTALFEKLDVSKHKGILSCVVDPNIDTDLYPLWYDCQPGQMCTILGEISNMPGHVVVLVGSGASRGKLISGLHDHNFLIVNNDYYYEEVDGKLIPKLYETPLFKNSSSKYHKNIYKNNPIFHENMAEAEFLSKVSHCHIH